MPGFGERFEPSRRPPRQQKGSRRIHDVGALLWRGVASPHTAVANWHGAGTLHFRCGVGMVGTWGGTMVRRRARLWPAV